MGSPERLTVPAKRTRPIPRRGALIHIAARTRANRSKRTTGADGIRDFVIVAFLGIQVWLALAVGLLSVTSGLRPVVIDGDSMSPGIRRGDVILLDRRAPTAGAPLEAGTVVTFEHPSHPGRLVTHRILAIDRDGRYRTRGDANVTADSDPIEPAAILGSGRVVVPFVGLPATWFAGRAWLPMSGWLAADLLAVRSLTSRSRHRKPPATPPERASWPPPVWPPTTWSPPTLSRSPAAARVATSSSRRRLVFALVASGAVCATALPVASAAFNHQTSDPMNSFSAASTFTRTMYLHNDPTPPTGSTNSHAWLGLDETAPTTPTLYNYDTDRDAFAGLIITKGTGLDETDPAKFQRWIHVTATDEHISGTAEVVVWSAMKDFASGKQASIIVGLYDCDATGGSCTMIASGSRHEPAWPSSWTPVTVDLGALDHTIAAGRSLVVTLVNSATSGDDVWFAYDTATYDSHLVVAA